MGSKANDSQKRKDAARHYQDKKRRYNTTLPQMRNLLDYPVSQLREMKIDILKDITVVSTNLFDNNGERESLIHSLSGMEGKEIVNSIYCPVCHKVIEINKFWYCYPCFNPEHGRMMFDIRYLKSEKLEFFEQRIIELEGIALSIEFDPNKRRRN